MNKNNLKDVGILILLTITSVSTAFSLLERNAFVARAETLPPVPHCSLIATNNYSYINQRNRIVAYPYNFPPSLIYLYDWGDGVYTVSNSKYVSSPYPGIYHYYVKVSGGGSLKAACDTSITYYSDNSPLLTPTPTPTPTPIPPSPPPTYSPQPPTSPDIDPPDIDPDDPDEPLASLTTSPNVSMSSSPEATYLPSNSPDPSNEPTPCPWYYFGYCGSTPVPDPSETSPQIASQSPDPSYSPSSSFAPSDEPAPYETPLGECSFWTSPLSYFLSIFTSTSCANPAPTPFLRPEATESPAASEMSAAVTPSNTPQSTETPTAYVAPLLAPASSAKTAASCNYRTIQSCQDAAPDCALVEVKVKNVLYAGRSPFSEGGKTWFCE